MGIEHSIEHVGDDLSMRFDALRDRSSRCRSLFTEERHQLRLQCDVRSVDRGSTIFGNEPDGLSVEFSATLKDE